MAILEKEVWVGLNGTNAKHFEKLGYEIPRNRFLNGKMVFPFGTKLLVKVKDIQPNSMIKLTKVCDECGKQTPNQRYDSITRSRKKGDGKDRCFECGKKKAREKLLNSIKYESSLEYRAKENKKEYLLEQYSDKNEKRPNEIAYGSTQLYLWNCPDCKSEYTMSADHRTNMNCNCPFCRGYQVNHTNSLWSLRPDIASLLKYKERGYNLTLGSNKLQEFICPDCGFEQRKSINTIMRHGFFSCVKCSDGVSYGEKFMANVLDQLNIRYEKERTFDWSENRRYDFYLRDLNWIIETHGAQHYDQEKGFKSYGGKTLEEEKKNDEFKLNNALKNGISKYIVIDCSKSQMEYIKSSIMQSHLSLYYNLNKIDWEKSNEFATTNNTIKTISDLWNSGIRNSIEIGKIVKLERGTVVKHLKRAKKLSWCDYDSKEVQRQNGLISGQLSKRKVVQLTKENKLMRIWDCAQDARRELGIFNISNACKGKYSHAGGFKWMYLEDYNQLIKSKQENHLQITQI